MDAASLVATAGKTGVDLTNTQADYNVAKTFLTSYFTRVGAAITQARTALRAAQTQTPPATPDAPPPYYPPADPGTGGGGGGTQPTSEAVYLLPVGAIALAAIYYFMRR